MLFSSSSIAPTPHIYKSLGYDTLTDLRAVATSGVLDGMLMLVDAKSPIKSVPEFIAFAKANRVLYGSPGVGNVLHLAAEVFAQKAGITMQHVPYKGSSEVMTALLGGSVQVMFVTPVSVIGLVKEGRVRALAFTGTKPFPEFPDVPLMKDLLPGYQPMGSWGMFYAPGKTPDAIVDKLNAAIREALKVPAGRRRHAARRLHPGQPHRRRNRGVLPQGGRGDGRRGEGRQDRAELNVQSTRHSRVEVPKPPAPLTFSA